MDFDITYDFRTDCGGKDPDSGSPTLRRYHRLLWSKKLPNGETMKLTHDNGGYLKWKSFEFASDQMANGLYFKRAKKTVSKLKNLLRDYDAFIEDYEHKVWTIGGEIIFPVHGNSMNQMRGTNAYIMDRWDLTLECIRRFYNGEDSPLVGVLDRDRDFYELFVDFKGYVDFFFLQDCVSPDYGSVIFWLDDYSLAKTLPLPKTAGEHLVWFEKNMQFVQNRATRMKNAFEKEAAKRSTAVCFIGEELIYHDVDAFDNYYEILDEVVNNLKIDPTLDVSTKRLRATRYPNGYARYIKINNYCCGILFDKANWEDSESVSTPFWLSITDSEWKLSESIRVWFDMKDSYQIAERWQKKPCLALIPPVNESYHCVCDSLEQQIVSAIRELG